MTPAPPSTATAEIIVEPVHVPMPTAREGNISPEELAQVLEAFNEVTTRLTRTHESLQSEVARLRGELQEANRQVERSKHLALLGEMAAGIAHEVRNPLGSILLYAKMLQHDLAEQPQPRQLADKIASAVRTLEAVVGDVLAFSRNGCVKKIEIESSGLIEAAAAAARSDGPIWENVDITLPKSDITLHADAGQLQQVLINLFRNAAEAMHVSKPKRITVAVKQASARQPDGTIAPFVAVTIKDTGPGVPPDAAEKLFTPFYTTRASGTGLGLAIVHRIMDAHGGRVAIRNWAKSDGSTGGAIVELLFPAQF